MKYTVKHTSTFKKSYKICIKQHLDMRLLDEVIERLAEILKM